jgi:hypothetical protein
VTASTTTRLGRFAASSILVLGALVVSSAIETGSLLLWGLAAAGLVGASLFVFGIERPAHPAARWARPAGWGLMLAFALVPSSLHLIPAAVVLLALPAAIGRVARDRRSAA